MKKQFSKKNINMKKIIPIICVSLLLMFGATSCSDFLTVNPQDSTPVEDYYTSEAAVRQNTASLYGVVWRDYQLCFQWMAGDELSGDMYYTYDQEGQFYYATFGANNTYTTQGWKGLYRVIAFANNIINDMPALASQNGVSDDVIQKAVAEARCIRGMAYYFLTEYWGDVPIVYDNVKQANEDLYRNTQSSVYEFIRRDLEFASETLPASDDAGRVTKWTAYGMLAKLHLTMASHLSDENSAANFALAKEYALKVINESGLSLYPTYATMFDATANNSSESLAAVQCFAGGYGYGNGRNTAWSRGSVIVDVTWGAGKGPTINLQNTFDANDIRRKWTYMTLDDYYSNLNTAAGGYTYKFVTTVDGVDIETASPMLAHLKKYVIGRTTDGNGDVGDSQDASNNVYLLRLSDVYLCYVEACIGSGTSTTDATALKCFNAIHHTRAGLAEVSSISYDQLIKERRCEFAFEGVNFFDIKRMFYRDQQKALDYLNNMHREQYYVQSGNYSESTKNSRDGYTLYTASTPITVTASQMYLPIPSSDVVSMPTLENDPVSFY